MLLAFTMLFSFKYIHWSGCELQGFKLMGEIPPVPTPRDLQIFVALSLATTCLWGVFQILATNRSPFGSLGIPLCILVSINHLRWKWLEDIPWSSFATATSPFNTNGSAHDLPRLSSSFCMAFLSPERVGWSLAVALFGLTLHLCVCLFLSTKGWNKQYENI